MEIERVLLIHNYYQQGGGEHTVFENEVCLLRDVYKRQLPLRPKHPAARLNSAARGFTGPTRRRAVILGPLPQTAPATPWHSWGLKALSLIHI